MLTALGRTLWLLVAAGTVLIPARPAWPQLAAAPDAATGIHLRLRLTVPAARFHQGELIPLELAYTSDIPKRYQITTSLQRFCGNDPPVQFVLRPAAATHDPEKLYWASNGGGCAGDILSGIGPLSQTPVTVPALLNDLVAIDRAGIYRLYAVSHQICDLGKAQPVPLEIRSNPIQFEVVPADPAWQRAQLDHIRQVLDHARVADGGIPGTPRAQAVQALRFLGGDDAAREMARRLRGEEPFSDFQFELGLIDSPQPATALAEMKKLLADPDFPISGGFLDAMAVISLDPKTSAGELFEQRNVQEHALREQLADVLSSKRGEALAVSLDTVMQEKSAVSAGAQGALIAQLLPSFTTLPAEKQLSWLQGHWAEVKDAMWLPFCAPLQAVTRTSPNRAKCRRGNRCRSAEPLSRIGTSSIRRARGKP